MELTSSTRTSITLTQDAAVAVETISLEQGIQSKAYPLEKISNDDVREPRFYHSQPHSIHVGDNTSNPNLVTFDGPNDPIDPQNWSNGYKWWITIYCCIMTFDVTFASSAPSVVTTAIAAEFNISSEVSYLTTSLFLLAYAFGPLLWGPGSELRGRREIFIITMSCYTLLHIGQALAPNIEVFLATRFLSGIFAVAPLVNCGGVIADIWSSTHRGIATSLFVVCVFWGPVVGPIAAGFMIERSLSWRWVFWLMMVMSAFTTILTLFFFPETYAPVILQRKAKRLRATDPIKNALLFAQHEDQDWSLKGLMKRTIYRPFIMLYKETILLLITIYISIIYGIVYALFQAFPIIFARKHGLTISQTGLTFISLGLGTTIGAIINAIFVRNYPVLMQKWKGFPPPEQRLHGAMIAGPLFIIGALWLGWTGQYPSIPWYVPAAAGIPLGAGVSLIFISLLSYVVDTYLMYSASAFAANVMVRSLVAAAFPLFTVQFFTRLGVNWAATSLACIVLLLSPMPFLFYRFGPRLRASSAFSPSLDLEIAKEMALQEKSDVV